MVSCEVNWKFVCLIGYCKIFDDYRTVCWPVSYTHLDVYKRQNFRLSAINGLNRESANIIIRLREQKAFSSVQDFFFRSFKAGVTAEEFIALIEAGALDSFNTNRAQLKVMFNTYLPTLDIGLFDNEAALHTIIVPEIKESDDRLDLEISRLRFPLSGNPLDKLKLKDIKRVSHILELEDGYIKTYGVLTSLRLIKTKKGDEMAFATASDYEEEINLVFLSLIHILNGLMMIF